MTGFASFFVLVRDAQRGAHLQMAGGHRGRSHFLRLKHQPHIYGRFVELTTEFQRCDKGLVGIAPKICINAENLGIARKEF